MFLQYLMDKNLSQVLLKLTKRILHSEVKSKHEALVKLLQRIDIDFFKNLNNLAEGDYESMTKIIANYYTEELKKRIKKVFMIKASYTEKFIHIFQLILDLVLHTNEFQKQKYFSEILSLEEDEKQLLMPYVDQVNKRDFIEDLAEVHEDLLDIKEKQYKELSDHYDELMQNHIQLSQNYNTLKEQCEKSNTDCMNFLEEKEWFMADLGMNPSSGFTEVAEKIKKDMKDFQHQCQRLNKQLEERNRLIVMKTEEIKELSSSAHNVEDSEKELREQIKKNNELSDCLAENYKKQDELKQEIEKLNESGEKLNKEMEEKEDAIRRFERTLEKYNEIKKIHNEFKKNLSKKYSNH